MPKKLYTVNELKTERNYFDGATMYHCETINEAEQAAVFTVYRECNGELIAKGKRTIYASELIFER